MNGVKQFVKRTYMVWRVAVWGVILLGLSLSLSLTGCNCPGPTTEGPGLPEGVEITQPQDKAVFNIEADADKSAPGIQISVEIKITPDSTNELPKELKGRILVNNKVAKEVAITATTVKFDGITLEEGVNSLQAVLELNGQTRNSNAIQVTADSKCYQIQFALPKNAQVFGNNDDADPQQSGFQTDVEIQVDPQALEEVELEIAGPNGQSNKVRAKPFGGKATFAKVTLPPGVVTLTARIQDTVGNACSDQIKVTVNTQAPTVTITAPTANQQLCPKDDADTNTENFQLNITATTTAPDGSTATLWLDGNKVEGKETNVANGSVSFQITLAAQFSAAGELQVKVKDKLGNEGTSAPVKFEAIQRGYNISFANLLEGQSLADDKDEDKNTAGLQFTVQIPTSAPDGESITLTQGNQAPQQVKIANGVAAVQLTFQEGQNCLTASVSEPKCSTNTEAKVCITVQPIGAPSLICSLEKGPAFANDVANLNSSHDTDAQKAGIQNGIKCTTDAQLGQSLSLTLNGNSQLVQLANAPGGLRQAEASGLDFQEGANSLILKVTNQAGKSKTLNLTVNVDTTAPQSIVDLGGSVADHRKSSVTLSWTAPNDNGATGSGVTGYEIRWSSIETTIKEGEWDKPEGKQSITSTIAAGQQVTATIDKLSVGKTYVFAVRAKDAGDNLSSISNVFKIAIDFKSTSSTGGNKISYGFSIAAVGDLDKDGRQDVVVCAPAYAAGNNSRAGAAFIYYGRDVATGSFFNTTPDVTITGDNASDSFCQQVEPMGDLNGDGFSDFAVRTFRADGAKGRVYIFFGGSRGTTLKNGSASSLARVTISGQTGIIFAAYITAVGIHGTPDINGDNKADLMISAMATTRTGSNFVGSVYVYYSRATYPQVGQPALKLEIKDADLEIINDTEPSGARGSFFGITMAAGNIDGDKNADILISASLSNTVVGLYGPIKPATGKTVNLSTFTDRFTIKGGPNENNTFGSSIAIVGDIDKDGSVDVVISSRSTDVGTLKNAGTSRLFSGKTLARKAIIPDTSAVVTWNGKAAFLGTVSRAGDVNGDGFGDFLLGEGFTLDPKNPSVARTGAVYLFFGRPFSQMQGGDPDKTADVIWYGSQAKAGLGFYGVVGGIDLTGDGFVDILMAETPPDTDPINGKIILKY